MAFVTPLFSSKFTSRSNSTISRRPFASPATMTMSIKNVPDVLIDILRRKETEVENLRAEIERTGDEHPVAKFLAKKGQLTRKKGLYSALNTSKGSLTVIAEIKRRSPSKGYIGEIKDPGALSRVYYDGGAGAVSVLTDLEGFGGTMEDLKNVVEVQSKYKGNFPGPCPVLRKDFIIDELQIAEAAQGGASAVLLIVSALGRDRTKELLEDTHAFGLDALVEVHDEEELQIAIDVGADIIGVNNRNLRDFSVTLDTSYRLAPMIPDGVVKVAESGIVDCIDAWKLRDAGYNAVLVGETLVKAFEGSSGSNTSYQVGYNEAKGYIKAFKAKGSVKYGNASAAAFFGKGEGAKETLGELSM